MSDYDAETQLEYCDVKEYFEEQLDEWRECLRDDAEECSFKFRKDIDAETLAYFSIHEDYRHRIVN